MTTANVTLTDNEIKVLESCLIYDVRECQLQCNPSDTVAADIAKLLGWTLQQAGGLMSSLQKKGMIWLEDHDDRTDVYLTDEGVNAIFDVIEARAQ